MNIADLLRKYAKEGDIFYTTIGGNVPLIGIGRNGSIQISEDGWCDLDEEGRLMHDGEMVIFPSKDQRDWTQWAAEKAMAIRRSQLEAGDYVTYKGGWGRIKSYGGKTMTEVCVYGNDNNILWLSRSLLSKLDHFDSKLLKPFDKVLVRDADGRTWFSDFFGYKRVNAKEFHCLNGISWKQCVPYNTETEHLLGTSDEAPEFYR